MAYQSQVLMHPDPRREFSWDHCCIDTLCEPHIPALSHVFTGEKPRYNLSFLNATFYFYHGCMLNQVMYLGKMILLPTIQQDHNGNPYWNVPNTPNLRWLTDLTQLPRAIVIFYFTLLRKLFPARQRWTGIHTLPSNILSFMEESGWSFS